MIKKKETNKVPENSTSNIDGKTIKEIDEIKQDTPLNLDKFKNGSTIITAYCRLIGMPVIEQHILIDLSMMSKVNYTLLQKSSHLKKDRCKQVVMDLFKKGYVTYENKELSINTDLLYADFIIGKNTKYAGQFDRSGNLGANPMNIKAIEDLMIEEKKLEKEEGRVAIMTEDLAESRTTRAKNNSDLSKKYKAMYKETNTKLRDLFKLNQAEKALDSIQEKLGINSEKELYKIAIDVLQYPESAIIKGTFKFATKLNNNQIQTVNIFGLRNMWVSYIKNTEGDLQTEVYKYMCSLDVAYPDKIAAIAQIRTGAMDVPQEYLDKIGLCVDIENTPYLPDPLKELMYYDKYPLWKGDGNVRL